MKNKAYKFRIYPTEEQVVLIEKTFGCTRFVYNYFLEQRTNVYKTEGRPVNYTEQQNQLPGLKKEYEWLKEVDSTSLQMSLRNLDQAFKNYYNDKRAGYPKFKSKKHSKPAYTVNFVNNNIKVKNGNIKLPKLGWMKAAVHRFVNGRIIKASVTKSSTGKYYVAICVEEEIATCPENDNAIGIDLGLKNFAALSTGDKIENPKVLKKYQHKMRRLQKDLSRKEKGSNNWKKAKHKLAKTHEKVANIRRDFLHKLSTKIIRENQTVVIESLKVKNMLKNGNLARSISDVSWSKFVGFLEYKADWYGRDLVKIDTWFPSSQLCSQCGYQNKYLTLDTRNWICPECNTDHDRDINASRNILEAGLEMQLQDTA